ncbi:sensor histidine kinase [Gulosibacter sp. 10]|uniref:sensor histidine kinase n=1 Tax=Gulosibacter sp. 10 TaxID=1255570 RepID=UPI00097EB620|nr:sensor histidine kinase [Gulosibacter sp. 10]SJM71655.1 sensor histidine kinase [Gulosibacter sp. 10]
MDVDETTAIERRRKARASTTRYAGIWTVFLLIPLFLILNLSEAGPVWDAIGIAAIVVFGVVYLAAFIPLQHFDESTGALVPKLAPLRLAGSTAVLIGIVAFTLPSLGGGVTAFLPYFVALGAFTMPLRQGLVWAAFWSLVPFTLVWWLSPEPVWGEVFGPLASVIFILVIRFIMEWGEVEDRARLELAAVREREEISRDVHDILGHTLTVVSLKTQLARRTLREHPDRAEAELDEVLDHVQHALDEVRATVGRLRIPELSAQLAGARTALQSSGILLSVSGSADRVAGEHRALFAWAVREATTNVVRHSEASECRIELERTRVRIADDGAGIGAPEGNGLTGLRRRVEDAGGALELRPADPAAERPGTVLEVRFA